MRTHKQQHADTYSRNEDTYIAGEYMQVWDPYIVGTEQLLIHRYGIPYLYILRTHRYGIPYLYILLRVPSYYYTCVLITM